MDMVSAGDLYPVELGQDHGHGLCRRSVSRRGGSRPWTWSVQEICIL